jgi:hypothetical protein
VSRRGQISIDDMEIRATNAARCNADEDLPGARLAGISRDEPKRFAGSA